MSDQERSREELEAENAELRGENTTLRDRLIAEEARLGRGSILIFERTRSCP
ncbi:MAG: hypothetical protein OXI20_14580 [Rhodospirillales bacterium]|nr:hypothetical protein [Rhodospirillales bacterium]